MSERCSECIENSCHVLESSSPVLYNVLYYVQKYKPKNTQDIYAQSQGLLSICLILRDAVFLQRIIITYTYN